MPTIFAREVAGDGDGAQLVAELQVRACRRCRRRPSPRSGPRGACPEVISIGLRVVVASSCRRWSGRRWSEPMFLLSRVDDGDVHRLATAPSARLDAVGLLRPASSAEAGSDSGLPVCRASSSASASLGVTVTSDDGGREELVEGGVHRVGEDQRAADERHRQQDGDGATAPSVPCARRSCAARSSGRSRRSVRAAASKSLHAVQDRLRGRAGTSRRRSGRRRGTAPGRRRRRRPGRG